MRELTGMVHAGMIVIEELFCVLLHSFHIRKAGIMHKRTAIVLKQRDLCVFMLSFLYLGTAAPSIACMVTHDSWWKAHVERLTPQERFIHAASLTRQSSSWRDG